MTHRDYFLVSGSVFGLVALLQLVRALLPRPFQFGPWFLPEWVSWLGVIVPGLL